MIALIVAVIAISGCGGSSHGSTSSNTTTDSSAASAAYREAIRANYDNCSNAAGECAPWYDNITDVTIEDGLVEVDTNLYYDDEGKSIAAGLCNAVDVAYGAPDHFAVDVYDADDNELAHCSPSAAAGG